MIYQVKDISGPVWGTCGFMQVSMGVHGYVRVCKGVHGCAGVCAGVWVCVDMHACAHVCGMNFQNFFQRIESLHQRTLIRILYEFF